MYFQDWMMCTTTTEWYRNKYTGEDGYLEGWDGYGTTGFWIGTLTGSKKLIQLAELHQDYEFIGTKYGPGYEHKCECGIEKVYGPAYEFHSDYCPKFKKDLK